MKRKLLFVALCVVGAMSFKAYAQISWTSKTDLITNPSFESDNAISDLKGCGWATDRATGWTISPSTAGNSQVGVGNSSSTIQGIGDKFDPFAGNNYFYTRNNWQKNTTFTFSQTIIASDNNMPSGLYKLTCKAATYSSDAAFGTLTLGLQEGSKAAVVHDGIVLNVWNTWGVILFKEADDSNLAIQINFKPGYDGNSKHYALLLDDFQLEYISAADAYAASSSNSIDFSDIINNAGIYNHSTKGTMPRGWTSSKHTTGNGNYTEGEKGDTRFEGWSGGNLDIDYNQTITNLPAGTYTVTASAHERAEVGRTYVYAFTEGKDKATGLVNSKNDTDITTSELKVTNKTMKIGFESTANDWVTADDFRITFLGFDVDAVKTAYEESYGIATTAYNDATYNTVNGVEKTTLGNAIDTYTTETTQNYGWYVQAKGALDEARTAFTESKPYYDLLETEKTKAANLGMTAEDIAIAAAATKTGLAALQDLKVAEYTYVTTNYQYGVSLGEWKSEATNTAAADFAGEHWSGDNSRKYKNQKDDWGNPKQGYAADSWSIKFNQDITLPAGNYVFKVAGRQASGDKVVTSLVVKNGDDVLGSVSDFPRSNSTRGIKKNGATAFEGDNEDFANDGKGYGWEWRYVKFTLVNDATVNIAIESVATAANQWVSFGDYTVQTDDETNISLITYNIALANAQTIIDEEDYENVTGTERTALQTAISADGSLDKTSKTAIDAATEALDNATQAFTAAKSAYDAFVAAKAKEYTDDLPYASATKFAAIATAQEAVDATSAEDATTKTAAIISAYRKYVESNALAEGVEGAVSIEIQDPNMEEEYDSENHKFGAWQVIGQTNGTISLRDNESFTDGEGNNNYKYADIYKNDNNAGIQQTVNLEPGKYLLTVTARAKTTSGAGFRVFAGGKTTEIQRIGNSGGTFDRGWNDASVEFIVEETKDVNIGVQSYNGKDLWWSATRFRLVKLEGEVELVTTVTAANKWGTFVAPFEVTLTGDDIKAYTIENDGYDANTKVLTLTEVNGTIEKNTPVILYYGGNTKGKLEASGVRDPVQNPTHGLLTGVYERTEAPDGSYILQKHDGDQTAAFYQVDHGTAKPNVPANKAYLTLPTQEQENDAKIILSVDDEATAIAGFEALTSGNMEGIYTTSGAKVNSLQKGVNIIRTKDGKSMKVYVK